MYNNGISCYCATYGRPKHLIENTIQCFLDQDWSGPKELIILNDCKYQKYFYNHPEIKIVNIEDRIPILGKKFNETVKLCQYNFLATWEDDDIFLKHRLSYSSKNLKNQVVFHTYDALIEQGRGVFKPFGCYGHSTHLIDRNLFDDIKGYDELDIRSIDVKFIAKIGSKIPKYSKGIQRPSDRFYIYRWYTSGSYHASGITKSDNLSQDIENKVLKDIDIGRIETGEIYLEPKLSYNYYDYDPINQKSA